MPMDLPHPALLALWVLWVGQAAWACTNILKFHERADRMSTRKDRQSKRVGAFEPPAVVIVPVKGDGEHFAQHIRALATQRYPSYRLVFAVESEGDPAWTALRSLCGELHREVSVVVSGRAQRGGQKVHNQLRGLRELRETDRVVVFADADAVPHDLWLAQLVHPLGSASAGATTGYRWLTPSGPGLASLLACVLNASVATLLGPPRRNHAWGGSMAITRERLDACRLVEHWQGALSDDYQLSRAVRGAGLSIVFIPRCLVLSPARHTLTSLLEFVRRQYIITRVHRPVLWLLAVAITGLYVGGLTSAVVAAVLRVPGWGWGLAAWGVVAALDLCRASLRRRAVRSLFGDEVAGAMRPVWRLERWGTPLWMTLHFLIILSAAVGRRITWARITYDMRGAQDVRIVARR